MTTKMKTLVNLVVYLMTVAINALGAFGYINGLSQKQVSDRFDTLITPSPFAFSIWSVIYTLLIITVLYWLFKAKQPETERTVNAVSPLFWLASAANILWVVAFSYEQMLLSMVLIFILVFALAMLNKKLIAQAGTVRRLSGLTFGLYNGWILIATVVQTAAWLVSTGWDGFGLAPAVWSVITLAASLLIVFFVQDQLRNAALTLPIAWAYIAIWHRNSAQGAYQGQYPIIITAALIGAVIAFAMTVWTFIRNRRCVLPQPERRDEAK